MTKTTKTTWMEWIKAEMERVGCYAFEDLTEKEIERIISDSKKTSLRIAVRNFNLS